jgi:hypothetical protein
MVATRTGLLAWRVERKHGRSIAAADLPGAQAPVTGSDSSLTVARQRGICTRFPISIRANRNVRTEEYLKELKKPEIEIYPECTGKSTRGQERPQITQMNADKP